MRDYQCDYCEEEELNGDFDTLWHLFDRCGCCTRQMIYNNCMIAFYESIKILQYYRAHIAEVTELLLNNRLVTAAESAGLFQEWGEPVGVFIDYSSFAAKLLDITDVAGGRILESGVRKND